MFFLLSIITIIINLLNIFLSPNSVYAYKHKNLLIFSENSNISASAYAYHKRYAYKNAIRQINVTLRTYFQLPSTSIVKSPGNLNSIQSRMASRTHSALYDIPIH